MLVIGVRPLFSTNSLILRARSAHYTRPPGQRAMLVPRKPLSRMLVLLIVTGLMVMGPLCSPGHGGARPINIGFVGDFSSVSQAYTKNAYQVIQLALAGINEAGGLLGRPVRIISRDGGNDPERHYRHVMDLVRDEKIVAVFGGASSPCVLKASAACKKMRIPYLVSIGNSQSVVVEYGHPYVFMFEPNTRMESTGFSIFASLMPWKRYAWIGPDYFWGRDVLGLFKKYFAEMGTSLEWTTEVWHPLGATEYSQAIQRILDSKPDALVVATWGEDLRHFVTQAKQRKLFDHMAAFGWFSMISGVDERTLPEGIWKISRGPFNYLAQKHPRAKAFIDKFARQYNTYPLDFSICAYDSLAAWRQAVLDAGSAEPAVVAGRLKGLSFEGLRGPSFIRAVDGQMNCPTFFGRLIYHEKYPFAVIESVIEIPADKTWLSESEVLSRRTNRDKP